MNANLKLWLKASAESGIIADGADILDIGGEARRTANVDEPRAERHHGLQSIVTPG